MNIKKILIGSIAGVGMLLATMSPAFAVDTTNITILPDSPLISTNNIVGVNGDYAPGFPYGSFASNGIDKSEINFTPQTLFGHDITLGDITSMSYWTKIGTTHAVSPGDWYLAIYTAAYPGQNTSFYGARIMRNHIFLKIL